MKTIIYHTKLLCVTLFLLLASCSSKKENISRVLELDSKANAGTTSIEQVVHRMEAISLEGCPEDFARAYREHTDAWRSAIIVEHLVKKHQDDFNSGGAFLEAFVRGVFFDFGIMGEERNARNEILAVATKADEDIKTTFRVVKSIAEKHGVTRK